MLPLYFVAFLGVWYCESLKCHKKTKIRALANHNVFAVLLTPPQGIATDRESRYQWAIHYFISDSSSIRINAIIANFIGGPNNFQFSIIAAKSESGAELGCAFGCAAAGICCFSGE